MEASSTVSITAAQCAEIVHVPAEARMASFESQLQPLFGTAMAVDIHTPAYPSMLNRLHIISWSG